MQHLEKLLTEIIESVTFTDGKKGEINSSQFRAVRARDIEQGGMTFSMFSPEIPQNLLALLIQELEQDLHTYINLKDKRIGNGMVNIMGGHLTPSIEKFSGDVVRAAAILGPKRVVALIFGWINGEPLRYKMNAVLTGLSIEYPMTLEEEGISITKLPLSAFDFYKLLPPGSQWQIPFHDTAGSVLLSIDCEASPALFQPLDNQGTTPNYKVEIASGKLQNFSLDRMCEALSLSCNNSVDWKYLWNNYGEIQEFNQMWGSTSFKDLPSYIQRVNMEFNDLKKAREIHIERTKSTTSNARLNTAISRWIQSKQSKILPDQFVDLRIALETLYLNEGSSELKFRLSAYGAWHLGSNFTERKEIFSTLQTAYDLASKAVHTGSVVHTQNNKNILSTAQDICRNGILKTIETGQVYKWNDLILGKSKPIP